MVEITVIQTRLFFAGAGFATHVTHQSDSSADISFTGSPLHVFSRQIRKSSTNLVLNLLALPEIHCSFALI